MSGHGIYIVNSTGACADRSNDEGRDRGHQGSTAEEPELRPRKARHSRAIQGRGPAGHVRGGLPSPLPDPGGREVLGPHGPRFQERHLALLGEDIQGHGIGSGSAGSRPLPLIVARNEHRM